MNTGGMTVEVTGTTVEWAWEDDDGIEEVAAEHFPPRHMLRRLPRLTSQVLPRLLRQYVYRRKG